ncbi:MAG: helix-turn-helix domain-containing protein [Clostridia bacterium]|nr:helix-turn-helix domain-containing protein [Clostridia bacterium]
MSNRLFQSVIHQMKDAVGRVIGLIDENGLVIACSELQKIGEMRQGVREVLSFSGEVAVVDGYTYRYVTSGVKNDNIIFVEGTDKSAEKFAALLAISLGSIKKLYDEKYDKASFIKNILLDNILPSDIFIKGKELRFNSDVRRAVLVIKFPERTDFSPYEVLQSMFPDRAKDYIISVSEHDMVLVKEMSQDSDMMKEAESIAASLYETLTTEFFVKRVSIGIGSIATSLKDLSRAYKEARIALEVGKVFDTEKTYISYDNLGIGRLIYQLPTSLCEIFLEEVFKKESLSTLDHETLGTVQSFFENNLNVSETSRKLFVHRNTLVYRLEKIRKLTGLDLRQFDDAVTFKVALMVKKYLVSKPTKF